MFGPDIIFFNGNVRTFDPANTLASAVALKGSKIVAVGGEDVRRLAGNDTRAIDLKGRTLIPGFIDPHVHMKEAQKYERGLDGAADKAELLAKLAEVLRRHEGGGWQIVSCSVNRSELWPLASDLDAIVNDRPVVLTLGGHVYATNTAGLRAAEITRETPHPFGGRIEHDAITGEPNGLLMDTARHLVLKRMERSNQPKTPLKEKILFSLAELGRCGITTVHDMVNAAEDVRTYQELENEGRLTACIHLLMRVKESKFDLESLVQLGITTGFGGRIKFGGVKLSYDGQFPSRGALMAEPYYGTDQTGAARVPLPELRRVVSLAHANDIRFCIHAYGDRATDEVLDAYEEAITSHPEKVLRHRIEHAGNVLCTDERIARMKRLGVMAVPNPSFLRSRGRMAEPWLGPVRGTRISRVKSILNSGCSIAVGTDWPGLQYISPLQCIESMVTRKTGEGVVLDEDEAIDAEAALRLYTVNNAYAGYEEHSKGTIEVGKQADVAVLDDDPVRVDPNRIGAIAVNYTVSDGRIVYNGS